MPTFARVLRQRTWWFLGAALGLLLAGTAACGPSDPAVLVAPTPTPHIQRLLHPTGRVPPSIEEQIFRSTTIVRATLQSATAAVETLPSDPGVTPTYLAVQELRFTVHEYLKGERPDVPAGGGARRPRLPDGGRGPRIRGLSPAGAGHDLGRAAGGAVPGDAGAAVHRDRLAVRVVEL